MNPKNEKIFSGVDTAQQEITAKTCQGAGGENADEDGAPFTPEH